MLLNLSDYEQAAASVLLPAIYDYYAGGSEDELTLHANRAAFERVAIRPRVLRPREPVLNTTLLGIPVEMPVAIAPTAYMRLAHPEGERAVVQAADATGTLAVLSINASVSLEQIAQAASGLLWQQLYLYPDRAFVRDLLARIVATERYGAVVLTVDRVRLGKRERELRSGFHLTQASAANFAQSVITPRLDDCPATWEDVAWLRSELALPVVLKGIMHAEDARLAVEHGAAAIVVSNHGGRQLDGALATLDALPSIVEAVAGRCEIYVDGGFRRGSEVFKALALGARAVWLGRPILWGLAVDGVQGVEAVLQIIREELELVMALSGCATLADLSTNLLQYREESCAWRWE